jgi:hypothetical protein
MRTISVLIFCAWFLSVLGIIAFLSIFLIFPRVRYWAYSILVSVDQTGNAILLGSYDETISSRAGRCIKAGGSCHWYINLLIKFIDFAAWKLFNDKDHCVKSIESGDVSRFESWNWVTGEIKPRW